MKITELILLQEAEGQATQQPKSQKQPKSQPSVEQPETVPQNSTADTTDAENDDELPPSDTDFKQSAVSLGDGMYALSAWVYPDAWTGSGYSDLLMHKISVLASDLDTDIGNYESIDDSSVELNRSVELAIYSEPTNTLFTLSASGVDGDISFSPDLNTLQRTGQITNQQMTKLKGLESKIQTWINSIPEDYAGGLPNKRQDPSWYTAERNLLKLLSFTDPGFEGDDAQYDPNSSEFWSRGDTMPKMTPDEIAAADERMKGYIEKYQAEKKQKKKNPAGRKKR